MGNDNELMSAESLDEAEPLDEDGVAARYKVTARTVKRWRAMRTGPRYFYAGRHVRYRMAALVEWEKDAELKAAS